MMPMKIAVVAELAAGLPTLVTGELIDFAKTLCLDRDSPIHVFVLGDKIEKAVSQLAEIPAVSVTGLAGAALAAYSAEAWKNVLVPRLVELNPRFVCVAHDSTGSDFAPGLAVRLGAGCIAAVEGARREANDVIFRRSILNGKMAADVISTADTTIITLLPGMFRGGAGETSPDPSLGAVGESQLPPGNAKIIPVGALALACRPLGFLPAPEKDADLAAAEVVVAAGRGIGKEENLSLVRDLAALFSRSAVGASRTLCDAGWLPSRVQIGQTGKTVTPRLYIACGISGALQHLMGMRASQFIVAVNTDPRAAIFQVADVAVVEDVVSFIPLLLNACTRFKKDGAP